jgi:hypothetical protein
MFDGILIPVNDELKFLGVIFDKKLSFKTAANLKKKCLKALNVINMVLSLYRALIRSIVGLWKYCLWIC